MVLLQDCELTCAPASAGSFNRVNRVKRASGQAGHRDILFGYPDVLVGVPPSPGLAAFASSRTRLTAWLFRSRWSLLPAHPRRIIGAQLRLLFIPYRTIENHKVHPAFTVVPVFQITVNVKVPEAKPPEVFFKYANLFCGKVDSPYAKVTI